MDRGKSRTKTSSTGSLETALQSAIEIPQGISYGPLFALNEGCATWSCFLQIKDELRASNKPSPLNVASAFITVDVAMGMEARSQQTKTETTAYDFPVTPFGHRLRQD